MVSARRRQAALVVAACRQNERRRLGSGTAWRWPMGAAWSRRRSPAASGFGGRNGAGDRGQPARADRRASAGPIAARGYRDGAAAPSRSSRGSGLDDTRPAYITATRSQRSAMTPISCEISTRPMPVSRRMSRMRSRIWAWIVASSAVVGSSAISTSGSPASAMRDHDALVHAAGEFMRILPFSRRGASAMPTRSSRRNALALGGVAGAGHDAGCSTSADMRADALYRIERTGRILKDHARCLPPRMVGESRVRGTAGDVASVEQDTRR
jgi:hypothetical protein